MADGMYWVNYPMVTSQTDLVRGITLSNYLKCNEQPIKSTPKNGAVYG